eukprot:TRINITY_DN40811_c0_g1_i1.p1 TRINITY_DN40811_c0_g1~~TRINITY_DN40811_c0_g1_i1.p1  ORF type:complete len:160 (+),score=6.71 TRINITY_DN40811_c0_g1_i1:299-778(+)
MFLMAPVSLVGSKFATRISDRRALLGLAGCSLCGALIFFADVLFDLTQTVSVATFTIASVVVLVCTTLERGFAQSLVTKLASPQRRQKAIGIFSCLWMSGRGVGALTGAVVSEAKAYTWLIVSLTAAKFAIVVLAYSNLVPYQTLSRSEASGDGKEATA